jgi:hypothetical protein
MKNSNFHILTQMVGTRNTPDEAYRVLAFELEEQEHALSLEEANQLLRQQQRKELTRAAKSWWPFKRVKATAALMKLTGDECRVEGAAVRAEQEVAFIKQLMTEIAPHRRYSHLPDDEAFQACQAEEWAAEHLKRATRFLVCDHKIPENYLEAMTVHPWWESYLMPRIAELNGLHQAGELGIHHLAADRPAFLLALEASHPELTIPAALPAGTPQFLLSA